jgi:hypothetical protein
VSTLQNEDVGRGGTGRGAAFATGGGAGSAGGGRSAAQATNNAAEPSPASHRLAPDRRRPGML